MSKCEFFDDNSEQCLEGNGDFKSNNIQSELIWGLAYRNLKQQEKKRDIPPKNSPFDIPFELCRAELLEKKMRRINKTKLKKIDQLAKDSQQIKTAKQSRKRTFELTKPSLLDRSIMSQRKYMDFLSIPNPKVTEPKKKKYKPRCQLEPCSPRFVQLSVPNKRKVFNTWNDYSHLLPAETLMRFEEILHTDQNLDPREARYYYKKLDREKRKNRIQQRKQEKKLKLAKEKKTNSDDVLIATIARDIIEYIQDQPMYRLNYKQLMISDGILERMEKTETLKKPSRTTKNYYDKTIIEASDKFAIWIDVLTRFVDVQAVESDDDIPPVSLSSLEQFGEGESDYESSSSQELEDEDIFSKKESMFSEIEGGEDVLSERKTSKDAEKFIGDIFNNGEEGDGELQDFVAEMDSDTLSRVIKVLENCSDEFLAGAIDEEKFPAIKYRDVLDKLNVIEKGLKAPTEDKPFLEELIVEWALKNEPDNVSDEMLKKIHEVSTFLDDWLHTGKMGDSQSIKKEPEDEIDYGQTGEDNGENLNDFVDDIDKESIGKESIDKESIGKESIGKESIDKESIGKESEKTAEDLENDYLESVETGLQNLGFPDEEIMPPDMLYPVGEEEISSSIKDLESQAEEGMLLDVDKEEVSVIYSPSADQEKEITEKESLDGRIIKGHKPSKVFEHNPEAVCCLSLKTWAVWLLEITHNAHNWTLWISSVIQQVREYASIVRGDVKLSDGTVKVLHKAEWRRFIKETDENIIAWRQYSAHVKDLSTSIVENFHGKSVNCCPKCLQDHLIRNVVVAHDTLQSLTEAISCAAYWQRILDSLVEKADILTHIPTDIIEKTDKDEAAISESSSAEIEDVEEKEEDSGESVYEIEGIEMSKADEIYV